MQFLRHVLMVVSLLLASPLWAQEPQIEKTPPPSVKEPEALSLVNEALSAIGGIAGVSGIKDYKATGSVTYHLGEDIQGTVTVRARGSHQLRIDANLPKGTRTEIISGSMTFKFEDGTIWKPRYQVPLSPARLFLPYLMMKPGITKTDISLSDKGMIQVDGHSMRDIRMERDLNSQSAREVLGDYVTMEFFFDPSTLQIAMMQDAIAKHRKREVRYADYRPVNGILVPFSISEQVSGQRTWDIQLENVSFNTGLQDSDFRLPEDSEKPSGSATTEPGEKQ